MPRHRDYDTDRQGYPNHKGYQSQHEALSQKYRENLFSTGSPAAHERDCPLLPIYQQICHQSNKEENQQNNLDAQYRGGDARDSHPLVEQVQDARCLATTKQWAEQSRPGEIGESKGTCEQTAIGIAIRRLVGGLHIIHVRHHLIQIIDREMREVQAIIPAQREIETTREDGVTLVLCCQLIREEKQALVGN